MHFSSQGQRDSFFLMVGALVALGLTILWVYYPIVTYGIVIITGFSAVIVWAGKRYSHRSLEYDCQHDE